MSKETQPQKAQREQGVKPWPFNGYAPGNYRNDCAVCQRTTYNVDKLCFVCLECAVIGAKQILEAQPSPVAKEAGGEEEAKAFAKDHCDKRVNTNTTQFQVEQIWLNGYTAAIAATPSQSPVEKEVGAQGKEESQDDMWGEIFDSFEESTRYFSPVSIGKKKSIEKVKAKYIIKKLISVITLCLLLYSCDKKQSAGTVTMLDPDTALFTTTITTPTTTPGLTIKRKP